MTITITHDPDDPRGCIACPFFHGPSWGADCGALDGADLEMSSDGLVFPAPDCPLRNGGVHVRRPEPIPADHHEPAIGDAVGAVPDNLRTAIRCLARAGETDRDCLARILRERREERDARQRDANDLCTLRAATASIAIVLGLPTDAQPGAIVERVEVLVRELSAGGGTLRRRADDVREVLGAREDERTVDAARRAVRDLAYARGAGTFAEAFDLIRAEARDGEGVLDTTRRLIREHFERGAALDEARREASAARDLMWDARSERDEARASLRATEHDLARLFSAIREEVGSRGGRVDLMRLVALCREIERNGCPGWLTAALDPATSEPVRREREAWQARVDAADALGDAATEARLAYCDGTIRDVCTALGLVEEETSRGDVLRAIEALRDVEPCCGAYRYGYSEEQGHHCLSCDESFPMSSRADAIADARREEREAWQARVDALRDALDAERKDVRAVLGAHEDERTVDAAIRVRRERDAAAACPNGRAAIDALGDVAETLGLDRDAPADEVVERVAVLAETDPEPVCEERPCTACDGRGVVALGGCETCGGSGVETVATGPLLAAIATAIPAIRAGINADGHAPEAVRTRCAARDALDTIEDAAGRPLASERSE